MKPRTRVVETISQKRIPETISQKRLSEDGGLKGVAIQRLRSSFEAAHRKKALRRGHCQSRETGRRTRTKLCLAEERGVDSVRMLEGHTVADLVQHPEFGADGLRDSLSDD